MIRLYYWFNGSPVDREGGVWWFRDYSNSRKLKEVLSSLKPFLHAWYITEECPILDPMNIRPPKNAKIVYNKKGETNEA